MVQDTTTLNFTGLHTIPELGPIDSGGLAVGVHLHTTLAVTVSGQVVGPLDQQYWARPSRGQPGPEEKESGKWINGIDASRAVLYEAAGDRPMPRLIHVMDREGDAYEVMMTVVNAGDSAIIRSRRTVGSTTHWRRRTRRCAAGPCWAGRKFACLARGEPPSGEPGWRSGRCRRC